MKTLRHGSRFLIAQEKYMKIKLSDHFTFGKLFKFTISSILMMIFTSIYSIVDGIFVSNFAGKEPFAAINLIMPIIMLFNGIGFMIGSGGSALIAKFLGEKNTKKANELFSFLIYFTIGLGIILSSVAWFIIPKIAKLMGAEGNVYNYAILYARTLITSTTAFMLQSVFQSFLIAAEKPQLGLFLTLLAGFTNIILDFLFVGIFKWGIVGAALATDISYFVGGIIPLIYFCIVKKSVLKLGKPSWDARALFKTLTNGSSELLTTISSSLVGMLYNIQLLKYSGVDGVAAYGVIMYVGMIFAAIFIGYSMGTAPIISYNYGAENKVELKNIFKKSLFIIGIGSILMFIASESLSGTFSAIFTSYDKNLFELTKKAFKIYSFSFLLCGINIYGSSFFTALNNGLISAIISASRTLCFQVTFILLLPVLFGSNGIWIAAPMAEFACMCLTIIFLITLRKKYNY